MTPQTVNAYYNPELNEIVFPAGILQPPFFDAGADDAVNYGAIGAVIGHEISHGFDDQGSQYDGDGNLRDWWTDEDHRRVRRQHEGAGRAIRRLQPVPGYHVNGELTLGENIADNSGLAIAYKAYRLSLGGKPAPVIDGLTGEQRFSWASPRCGAARCATRAACADQDRSALAGRVPRQRHAATSRASTKPSASSRATKMYRAPKERVIMW